jgi:glycosyltransferase involved in cell wall biosynthesis
MRNRNEAPDVIHAHVFSAGFIALLLSRRRYPVVVSEHHSDFIEGKVRGRDALVARTTFTHAAVVCPVSRRLSSHLQTLAPSGRYDVIPNVVDIDRFLPRQARRAERRAGARFLVVATLAPQKGIDILLSALSQVHRTRSDFSLDIVGDGPSRWTLEQCARQLLPPGVVTFHGAQPRHKVATYMAQSDVLVVPSVVETFGVVVIEAVAAGLPIIATRAVPDYERLEGRFGIIVEPGSTDALRKAILMMLAEEPRLPRDEALAFIRSFGAAASAERWDTIYRRAVTRR